MFIRGSVVRSLAIVPRGDGAIARKGVRMKQCVRVVVAVGACGFLGVGGVAWAQGHGANPASMIVAADAITPNFALACGPN